MKGIALIIVIVGSVVGGAAGGVVATQYIAPQKTERAQVQSAATEEGHDYSSELANQEKTIRDLTGKVSSLNARLEAAEKRAADSEKLDKKVDELKDTVAKVETKVASAPTGGEAAPTGDDNLSVAKREEEYNKFADAREKKKEEERKAAREKERAEERARRNAAVVSEMDKKLMLDTTQKDKITKVLEAQNIKMEELRAKGDAAREKGEAFDWRKEMGTVFTETTTLVRNELNASQQSTFDELTKDRGMMAFMGDQWGGGMGGRRGGNDRGGNNGGGNGN